MEAGILSALTALQNQIERELQRNPEQTSTHGVSKWIPMQKRVEHISTFLVDYLSEQQITLESLLVFAQSFTKVAAIISNELGSEGLGKVRTEYVHKTLEIIQRDCRNAELVEQPQ